MIDPLTLISVLGITFNSIGFFTLPNIVGFGVDRMISLDPKGPIYEFFINPPFGTTAEYYIYEVKNPRDFLKGKKPMLGLRGPFIVKTFIERSNLNMKSSNEVFGYDTCRKAILVEEGSDNLDDKFWQLNPILPTLRDTVKSMVLDRIPFKRLTEPIVFNGLNVALDTYKERLLVKRSARQLLNGVKVDMLESVVKVADTVGLKSLIPPGPPDNMFGLLHAQNFTVDKLEVYTGVGSSKGRFGEVIRWQNSKRIKAWPDNCGVIAGTNGELFKPLIKAGQSLNVFFAPLCRSFQLHPVGDQTKQIHSGLIAYEYELSDKLYRGVKNESQNSCYCSNQKAYDCYYDGLIRMGPCFFDAPLFFTRPNFKGLNRKIRSLLDENQMNKTLPEKQSFYLDPTTGAILKVNITLVGAFKVVKQPYLRDMANVQNLTYLPLFAASEGVELPIQLTWQVLLVQRLLSYHKYINGTLVVVISISLILRLRRKRVKAVPKETSGSQRRSQRSQQSGSQQQSRPGSRRRDTSIS